MEDPRVLDANAVAGALHDLFGREVTAAMHECAHCGHTGAIGSLRAWIGGPGVVLRCLGCDEVVLRWARTPGGFRVDLRGAVSVAMPVRSD